MAAKGSEKRTKARRPPASPARVLVSSYGDARGPRKLVSKLVDTSEGGLGVEMYVPLVIGSTVLLEAELDNQDLSLAVCGKAKVVHCRCLEGGTFRVGLAFEEVAYRKIA